MLADPRAKRKRAQGEDEKIDEQRKFLEADQEFRRLEAVSVVQDELNALEEDEAQQVCCYRSKFGIMLNSQSAPCLRFLDIPGHLEP